MQNKILDNKNILKIKCFSIDIGENRVQGEDTKQTKGLFFI